MPKTLIPILILTVTAILITWIYFPRKSTGVSFKLKNQPFNFEVAKTVPQQEKGLMYRTSLCPDCGMIFVFSLQMPQTFWMKNTLIPLDMIFIDKNGKINTIVTAVPEPGIPDSRLTLYTSASPAKYVIEVNAGTAAKIGLNVGDTISLPPGF